MTSPLATPIPGLTVWSLPLHGDARGWFKENWQREKMVAAGLPDFGPVQNNISFNEAAGVTRGIHAEPWDKFVSVATGRIFGAWVDLRPGPCFGQVFTHEIGPDDAVFVPRGVGNAYQTLEPGTAYSYLVNEHWSPDATYTFVNLADPALAIAWPIALDQAVLSDKDRAHPQLAAVIPMPPLRTLVLGANGQLGRAMRVAMAGDDTLDPVDTVGSVDAVDFAGRDDIDLAAATVESLEAFRAWQNYDTVINAAAYTAVDAAETAAGRRDAWATNVTGVAALAEVARRHRLRLVHISSDYVFDGTASEPYQIDDTICPLGVYGQTKAAGEALVAAVPRHYVIRTSWVVGDGANFVRTMARLAERGIDPAVVDDQIGRLTFTDELARGIRHLIAAHAPAGTYHLTGAGEAASWAQIAAAVFDFTGHDPARVRPVSTAHYYADADGPVAPRPAYSVLDLASITATGFTPRDWRESLADDLSVHDPA